MIKNKVGIISEIGKPNERWQYKEASYTRTITSRSDRVKSKAFAYPMDYEDVEFNTKQMNRDGIILVKEWFFVDDTLREKAEQWVKWANTVSPKEYGDLSV